MNSKYFSLKEKKIPLPFFFCSFASPLGFSFLTKILFIDLKIEFFCHYLVLIRENVQISKSNLETLKVELDYAIRYVILPLLNELGFCNKMLGKLVRIYILVRSVVIHLFLLKNMRNYWIRPCFLHFDNYMLSDRISLN